MKDIIAYESTIFEKLKKEFLNLIEIIKKKQLSIHNIELLNQINNDMNCLIMTFREINELLQLNPLNDSVKQKIKQITSINSKINEILPSLLIETL